MKEVKISFERCCITLLRHIIYIRLCNKSGCVYDKRFSCLLALQKSTFVMKFCHLTTSLIVKSTGPNWIWKHHSRAENKVIFHYVDIYSAYDIHVYVDACTLRQKYHYSLVINFTSSIFIHHILMIFTRLFFYYLLFCKIKIIQCIIKILKYR